MQLRRDPLCSNAILRFLGKDVFRTALQPIPPAEPLTNDERLGLVGGRPVCVHRVYNQTLREYIRCGNCSVMRRHGWLCADHQTLDQHKHVEPSFVEIEAAELVRAERARVGGVRFDHNHLMRASIYNADGSPKFPW